MNTRPNLLLPHGGNLADAARLRPDIPDDRWLDLSTGINPIGYPVDQIDPAIWRRLPDANLEQRCVAAGRDYYQAHPDAGVVITAGSQQAIQHLPSLFDPGDVGIVGPTYNEHAAAWQAAGHEVRILDRSTIAEAAAAVLVLVNPNNPDGHAIDRAMLMRCIGERSEAGKWTIVDEAFMDLTPRQSVADCVPRQRLVVLKSVGKFFGLAGARVGHAILPSPLAVRLRTGLGPWPVAGPSLAVACDAFGNRDWQLATRKRIVSLAGDLVAALSGGPLNRVGGTDLFHYCRCEDAATAFERLLDHGIYVRRFTNDTHHLRLGLPPDSAGLARIVSALGGQ